MCKIAEINWIWKYLRRTTLVNNSPSWLLPPYSHKLQTFYNNTWNITIRKKERRTKKCPLFETTNHSVLSINQSFSIILKFPCSSLKVYLRHRAKWLHQETVAGARLHQKWPHLCWWLELITGGGHPAPGHHPIPGITILGVRWRKSGITFCSEYYEFN